jgi:hypothetical protein
MSELQLPTVNRAPAALPPDKELAARDAEIAVLRLENRRLRAGNTRLGDLITWINHCIPRRNANGMQSDQFCLLCYRGIPVTPATCRHDEIRAIATQGVKTPPRGTPED